MAITVPAWLAEQVCWALNDEYHAPFVPGGHVRIYSEPELRSKLRAAGLRPGAAHHAHALHTPYWWLKCAVGPTNNDHPLVRAYHEVLLWDIAGRQPMARFTKLADRLANPLLGFRLQLRDLAAQPLGRLLAGPGLDLLLLGGELGRPFLGLGCSRLRLAQP